MAGMASHRVQEDRNLAVRSSIRNQNLDNLVENAVDFIIKNAGKLVFEDKIGFDGKIVHAEIDMRNGPNRRIFDSVLDHAAAIANVMCKDVGHISREDYRIKLVKRASMPKGFDADIDDHNNITMVEDMINGSSTRDYLPKEKAELLDEIFVSFRDGKSPERLDHLLRLYQMIGLYDTLVHEMVHAVQNKYGASDSRTALTSLKRDVTFKFGNVKKKMTENIPMDNEIQAEKVHKELIMFEGVASFCESIIMDKTMEMMKRQEPDYISGMALKFGLHLIFNENRLLEENLKWFLGAVNEHGSQHSIRLLTRHLKTLMDDELEQFDSHISGLRLVAIIYMANKGNFAQTLNALFKKSNSNDLYREAIAVLPDAIRYVESKYGMIRSN